MLTFCSLASGSSGNAAVVIAGDRSVLIDMGISCSRLEKALAELSLHPEQLGAVLITHAHSDHVQGLPTFMKRYKVPFYMKKDTHDVLCDNKRFSFAGADVRFITDERLTFGPLGVHVFRLPHQGWLPGGMDDAGAHIGFKFIYNDKSLGFFTDLGKMPEEVFPHINDCDYYVLEANHDVLWQRMAKRPQGVIDRNLKSFGHLSNHQAGDILTRIIKPKRTERKTKGVMLAHLSRDCNNPILAEDTILKTFTAKKVDPVEIKFAPPGKRSEIIRI